MPIPKPKPEETQNEFMKRCMTDPTMEKEFPKSKQRIAVCLDAYREATE